MLKHGGFTNYDRKTTRQDSNEKYKYPSYNQNYIRFHMPSPIDLFGLNRNKLMYSMTLSIT